MSNTLKACPKCGGTVGGLEMEKHYAYTETYFGTVHCGHCRYQLTISVQATNKASAVIKAEQEWNRHIPTKAVVPARCPLCGNKARTDWDVYALCLNGKCILSKFSIPIEQWQSRPREKALQAKITTLLKAVKKKEETT